jgi:hypothetical protein
MIQEFRAPRRLIALKCQQALHPQNARLRARIEGTPAHRIVANPLQGVFGRDALSALYGELCCIEICDELTRKGALEQPKLRNVGTR